jgi:hypothetical protein
VKRVPPIAFVLFSLIVVAGCKTSDAPPPPAAEAPQDASMQPPMPSGMLAAPPSPSAAALAKSLRSVREATTGEWIEVQPAPEGESPKKTKFDYFKKDSLFIPLDAMSLLHDSFARAHQGFALFTPQLFVALTLGELKTQLKEFRRIWSSVPTASVARARWPFSARVKIALTDELWRDFQAELVYTIDEITKFADGQIQKGEGAWNLPTQGR